MSDRPSFFDDDDFDEEGAFDDPPPFFPDDISSRGSGAPVPVRVEGLYGTEVSTKDNRSIVQRFVQLEDKDERRLQVMIGPFEAMAISMAMEGAKPDRPLTHDLLKTFLDRLGAELDRVVIDDLWNGTYYAKVYLTFGDEEIEIDSRPSDAIALALRCHPDRPKLYVLESVFDAAEERPEE